MGQEYETNEFSLADPWTYIANNIQEETRQWFTDSARFHTMFMLAAIAFIVLDTVLERTSSILTLIWFALAHFGWALSWTIRDQDRQAAAQAQEKDDSPDKKENH